MARDGRVVGADRRDEACVSVAAAGAALCYAWKIDNSGPHSLPEAELIFDAVQLLFPAATVQASDAFDDFVAAVEPHRASLPVVTAEIGDTWIMGTSADPKKVALYRAASRAHAACTRRGDCVARSGGDERALRSFERLLMVAAEHTRAVRDSTPLTLHTHSRLAMTL